MELTTRATLEVKRSPNRGSWKRLLTRTRTRAEPSSPVDSFEAASRMENGSHFGSRSGSSDGEMVPGPSAATTCETVELVEVSTVTTPATPATPFTPATVTASATSTKLASSLARLCGARKDPTPRPWIDNTGYQLYVRELPCSKQDCQYVDGDVLTEFLSNKYGAQDNYDAPWLFEAVRFLFPDL